MSGFGPTTQWSENAETASESANEASAGPSVQVVWMAAGTPPQSSHETKSLVILIISKGYYLAKRKEASSQAKPAAASSALGGISNSHHLQPPASPKPTGMEGLWGRARGDQIAAAWDAVRARAVAPVLQAAVWACMGMSVMLVIEVTYMSLVSFVAIKLLRRVPERRYKWEPMPCSCSCSDGSGKGEDVEAAVGGGEVFPMVLVQIPMYNEMEVYKLSIGAACALTWLPGRIIIQVLDDSTDPLIKELVEFECKEWASKKINIKYEVRDNRKGYKAGALKKGMEHRYVQQLNYDVCLMTRIQKMSLDYHFKVEQESGSSMHSFFGFNGTAGVWRVSAINAAGGWKDRTTVEDMDLAVRASLHGWQFLYVGDIRGVSLWKKLHLLYSFFFVRRVIAPILTFLFYCVVIPLSAMVPEVNIPIWGMFYIPTAITIMNAIRNPGSIHLVPIWILFENVMSMHRMRAALTGLLETMYVDEWVVTEKVGGHVKDKLEVPLLEPVKPTECVERIYIPEILLSLYLLVCASYDFVFGAGHYYLYIFLQAFAFLLLGLGFVGTAEPCYSCS
ncbi:hypothetical protein PR202_gb18714 [Eleusine coracana subsp. coracana]|uniref:Glycosyltransferase 2-like domain-containing protein n=1 Tax=Eleusine coracana subsp. coracana TaxID=191504 RepID=A0AAV5F6B0_ELECO|nr:hypothetical protein PR202_gb18714 [Eleusine coracana subsp. coracana]